MNQEEVKIYQLIKSKDVNNWELAYQLSISLYGEDRAKVSVANYLTLLENKLFRDYNNGKISSEHIMNILYHLQEFKQTKNMK